MDVHTWKNISIPKAHFDHIKLRFLSDHLVGNVTFSLTKSVHVFAIMCACVLIKNTFETKVIDWFLQGIHLGYR